MEIDRWKNRILSQSYRTNIKGLFLSETFWRLCRILVLRLVTSSKLQAILKSLEWAHRLCSHFGRFAYKAGLFVLHESLQAVSQTSMTVMKVTVRDRETITEEECAVTKGERSNGLTALMFNSAERENLVCIMWRTINNSLFRCLFLKASFGIQQMILPLIRWSLMAFKCPQTFSVLKS